MDEDHAVPLALDLDGTLLLTDTLHEALLVHLRSRFSDVFRLPLWLTSGRAGFKDRVAAALTQEDVDSLPVVAEIVTLAEREAKAGRKVVLVTAANRLIAEKIAARFPFISEVMASDGQTNLKGAVKAEALAARFPDGFIYAGDSTADFAVWEKARGAIVVEHGSGMAQQAAQFTKVLAVIDGRDPLKSVLRKTLRLHQWAKNALVFVPLLLGGLMFSPQAWWAASLAFLALGLLASATYIANDMWDLSDDRLHWSKRSRPMASGRLSLARGAGLLVFCGSTAFILGAINGPAAVATLAIYLTLSLLYSFWLKREPIVDVLLLAVMFTIRLVLGQAVTNAVLSPWLLVFSMFIFLSLSLVKRHTETLRMIDHGHEKTLGRGYIATDAPVLLGLGVSSSMAAVLIMVLYLINDAFQAQFYRHSAFLWGFPVIIFLFLARIWLLCHRGQINDDPVAFALKDRLSLTLAAASALLFAAAIVPV
jgi:4-hydroxybenzoate polyprenyltransferase/phosphoglycolate phosphatase-like HAD superfamily hydrolase